MTAATNVIILWNTNGSAPSGWTDTGAAHTGRIMYIYNASIGGHGGSDTHTHTYASNSAGNSSATHHNGGGKFANYDATTQAHTHTLSSTTVSTENSMPPYKNYGLYYRALAGWDGKVPAGTVAMIGTCPTNWTKIDEGSDYFIRVVGDAETKGGTGGTTTHTHTLAGTLSALTSSNQIAGTATNYDWAKDHGHTYSGSSSSQSNIGNLAYTGAGLVKADVETHVTQNMYLWFDGDVPATFDAYTAGGFLRVAPTNTFTSGGSVGSISHAHDSFNITSSAMSNSMRSDNYSLGANWVIEAHTHAVSGSLNSTDMQPSYFILNMGKAKATFYSTVNPTYTSDALFFGTANYTYTVDRRLKGTALVTYGVDRRLQGTASLTANLDLLAQKAFESTYDMDTKITAFFLESACDMETTIKADTPITYTLDALVQKLDLESTHDPDVLLRTTFENTDLDIDVYITNTFTQACTMDLLASIDRSKTYTADLHTKGANEAVLPSDFTLVQVKRTGYGGRCNVQLNDIESSYGMAVEICSRPRHYEVKRPVPYVFVPDKVPEHINGDNITMADIPGADKQPFVYPETTTPTVENPITPTQYEETRGNEPNQKQPFAEQVVESEKV